MTPTPPAAGPAPGAAEQRERELAAARAEATGAEDAIVRLQLRLGEARAQLAATQQLVDEEREQAARQLRRAQALAHAALAAGKESERQRAGAQARAAEELAAVKAGGDVERDGLRTRITSLRRELDERDRRLAEATTQDQALRTRLDELGARLDREQAARARSDATVERVLATSAALLRKRQDALATAATATAAPTTPPETATPAPARPGPATTGIPQAPRPGGAVAASQQLLDRLQRLREELAASGPGSVVSPDPAGSGAGDASPGRVEP
jgi:hypothetical protein